MIDERRQIVEGFLRMTGTVNISWGDRREDAGTHV